MKKLLFMLLFPLYCFSQSNTEETINIINAHSAPFDSLHCYTVLYADSFIGCSPVYIGATQTNFSGDINLNQSTGVIKTNNNIVFNTGFGGPDNTAAGYVSAGSFGGVTGMRNTAFGASALSILSTGFRNVAIGSHAGEQTDTGRCNVYIGDDAADQATGSWNTAIGAYSGPIDPSDGNYNIAIGFRAKNFGNNTATFGHAQDQPGANLAYTVKTGMGTCYPRAKLHVRKDSTNMVALAVYGDTRDTGSVYVHGALTVDSVVNLTGLTVGGDSILTKNSSGKIFYKPPAASVVAGNDSSGRQTSITNFINYTESAGAATYRLGGYLTTTAISAATITMTVTYTDENSASRTQTFTTIGGVTGVTALGAFAYSDFRIRTAGGNSISVNVTLTGVSATYDVGATIEKISR